MIRTGLVAGGLLTLMLLAPSIALAQCDLFEPPVQCNARKARPARAEWQHAVEEQQKLNRQRIQFSKISARREPLSGRVSRQARSADKAQADFALLLWKKDIIYLRQNLQAPVLKDATGRRVRSAARTRSRRCSAFRSTTGSRNRRRRNSKHG